MSPNSHIARRQGGYELLVWRYLGENLAACSPRRFRTITQAASPTH